MSFIKNYVNADGRSSRRRIFILSVSLALLTALISGLVIAGILVHRSGSGDAPGAPTSTADAIRSICSVTLYPKSCFSALISSGSSDPEKLFQFSLTAAIGALESIADFPKAYAKKAGDNLAKEALGICGDLLSDAADSLNDTVSAARLASGDYIDDLRTWLSAAITDMETCLDALEEASVAFAGEIQHLMRNSTELASNSLAIVSNLIAVLADLRGPFHRRLLADEFPAWFPEGERRILQETAPKPDITVSKDGAGDFKTLKEAVAKIPKKSDRRFVIHVKAGTYYENVVLEKHFWNVMIYGDSTGSHRTVITGDTNFMDGTPTFNTSTFAARGKGFIARDLVFQNTAGAGKHQAVAMRSQSDLSIFYRCTFDAYQDTLYAHSNRQFYRECNIMGTVDFIFGNAAVVFQKCNIMPRQPMANQFNTITAQGKKEKNMNTGISIIGCVMKPWGTNFTAPTYLGRPWKAFSTTVIMKTEIGGFLNPAGWIAWVQNVTPPSTIFYGEYENTGPGANTSRRVTWDGYSSQLSLGNASKYSVENLIVGKSWLNGSGVPFDISLL